MVKERASRVRGPIEIKLHVERQDCRVTQVIGNQINSIEKIIPGQEITNHLIKIELTSSIRYKLTENSVKIINLGNNYAWAKAPSCSACKFFSQSDVLILDAIPINEYAITYRIIVPSFTVLKSILKSLNELNLKPKVLSKKEVTISDETIKLTPRQLQALILAYKRGYFDVDRLITLTEISKLLNIAPSSAQEILRRALKKVIEDYLSKLKGF
ncbi:MAG: helix-turn-helix domain-containing protein [Thermoprotei archaeon]|jgi:predicted DNA binding protein